MASEISGLNINNGTVNPEDANETLQKNRRAVRQDYGNLRVHKESGGNGMDGIVTESKVIKTRYVVYQHLSEEHKKIYDEADLYISSKYNLFCACGRLCTGLHERTCAKFRNAVNREFFKRIGV